MDTGQEPGHEAGLGGSHAAPVRGLVLKHVSHTTPGIICQRQTQSELITDDIIHTIQVASEILSSCSLGPKQKILADNDLISCHCFLKACISL